VLLGFEAADPKRPFAALWDTGPLVTLTIVANTINLANAEGTVIRDGDLVVLSDGSFGTITLTGSTHPSGTSDVNA